MARKPERGADDGSRNSRRLSDVAYARILENLFDRQLPAGAFVSQNDLVTLLGIPVGPLRDALRVLEAEGVLKIHPRSGIEFVKPGLELTRSTYQFRTIIERAAVRMFAETAPSSCSRSFAPSMRRSSPGWCPARSIRRHCWSSNVSRRGCTIRSSGSCRTR